MRQHHVIADMLTSVFNELLVKGSTDAWVAAIRMTFDDHASEEELDSVGGTLLVACYAPSNYVSVMAAFSERPVFAGEPKGLTWKPITCHDSCWREGVESTVNNVYEQVEKVAVDSFKRPVKELSLYMKLDMLKTFDGQKLLGDALEGPRHGKIVLNPDLTVA